MSSNTDTLQNSVNARDHSGWSLAVALRLGRVSNLPTVWTNTVAAVMIAGATLSLHDLLLLLMAMSFAYMGGMYLNDAFDRHIDASERPERPIPSGLVRASEVFAAGFTMLALAVALTGLAAYAAGQSLPAMASAVVLTLCIVLYDGWHKGNPLSPLVMGLCRVMVYITSALTVSNTLPPVLFAAALVTLGYLIGLTYAARQENLGRIGSTWPLLFLAAPVILGISLAGVSVYNWITVTILTGWMLHCLHLLLRAGKGDIPRAVVRMIAGISLVDALLILTAAAIAQQSPGAAFMAAILCYLGFATTLLLQRWVSGT